MAQRPKGIDVSHWQGTALDWPAIKNSGIAFAYAKASEGNGSTDDTFVINETNAKAAGVPIGAYHYARYDLNTGNSGATNEANWFWSVAKKYIRGGGSYMMPMLDVEASTSAYTTTTLSQWVDTWCTVVSNNAAAVGVTVKPVIYASACNANCKFNSTIAKWIPWVANWSGTDGQSGTPWSVCSSCNVWGGTGTWTLWQYGGTTVPNHSGNVDADVFNGTLTGLTNTLIIPGVGNYASVLSSNIPGGVLPGATFTATITMTNDGATAWTDTGANPYKLGSQGPQDNSTWGTNRVVLPSSTINPGQTAVFTFMATAPSAPGTYTFSWKMLQEGVQWFGDTFTATIIVGDSASIVSSTIPSTVTIGQSFTAIIKMKNNGGTTWTNSGATPYKLGSQTPQNNTTWGTNRVSLPSATINPGANATFTFTATAPSTIGTYTFAWKMLQEATNWFGSTFSTNIAVVLGGPGTNSGLYTMDTGNIDSTSRSGSYVSFTTCGNLTGWYSYGVPGPAGSSCMIYNRDIRWMPTLPTYGFTGRGYLTASMLVPDNHSTATVKFYAVNAAGSDLAGPLTGTINECPLSCSNKTFYNTSVNVTSFGGFRSNTQDDSPAGGACNTNCGAFTAGYSQMRIQAARWQYMNDWTCLGGYSSTNVNDTSNRSFNEANLYLYPAVDATHGNVITTLMGLNSRTPARVTTGDCNSTNSLNFKGNASAHGGGDNTDSYGFAWIFTPAGATPKFAIGSSDGNRLWVNGVLKNDTNATRSLTRDQDTNATAALTAGWNRVLFKVHNLTNSFQGTVSLRSGTNINLNEPAVNYYDFGGYYSYSLGYEQDAWYPQIVVSNIYGANNPVNGAAYYGNDTTVTANGKSNGQGPVPYWRTMQYQWGSGLGDADSDYADVSGTPTGTNWSNSATNVTGHRRIHFFSVSKSGRTSAQNSGINGGSTFQDTGNYARYYDIYVDNIPPQDSGFSSVTAVGTNQINVAWPIPLDQGVNVEPGSTESAGGAANQDSQNWYRVGDVGVQVYRDGSILSTWGTGTAINDTGLTANSPYTYTLEARDNNTGTRGLWHNSTGSQGTNTAWTLSVSPTAGSITPNQTNPPAGSNVTWTAVGGFGAGKIQYYRYVWDQLATHLFTDTEAQWSSGTISTVPDSEGNWYLHVKGYNGADIGNGTYDYSVASSQVQPQFLSITTTNGIVTFTWSAVSGSNYRIQYTPDIDTTNWTALSPDVQASGSTASATNDTGGDQRFYRVMLLP